MKKCIILTTVICLVSSIFAEATPPKKTPINVQGNPKICIIRSTGFGGSLKRFPFYFDMRMLAKVKNNHYVITEVDSGQHKVMATFKGGEVLRRKYEFYQGEFDFQAGVTYYFYMSMIPGYFTNKLRLVEISQRQGEAMLRGTSFREQN
jgi:hypothetical protein